MNMTALRKNTNLTPKEFNAVRKAIQEAGYSDSVDEIADMLKEYKVTINTGRDGNDYALFSDPTNIPSDIAVSVEDRFVIDDIDEITDLFY